MKKAALALLLLVLVPLQAAALENEEILGLVAMPLAVAAASNVTGVPAGDLSHFVATLNRAYVPPTQFVQVVRYAPAALVVEREPRFVEYVDQQVYDGVVGPRLVTVIEDRYRTYDLEPEFVVLDEPATTYVVRDDYIPPVVVTRVAQVGGYSSPYGFGSYPSYAPSYSRVGDTNDLLSLIAMPLAVAAVSNIAGVPVRDLSSLVMSLNAARMPSYQVVEVLRYSPVVLVSNYERPRFIRYVNTQVVSGVRGPALYEVIEDRYDSYYEPEFEFDRTPDVRYVDYADANFFPPVVTTHVAEVRAHPHGGPPGQLKKELGYQTGAEVVHGTRPGSYSRDRAVRTTRVERERPDRIRHDRVAERKVARERVVKERRQPEQKVRRAKRSDTRAVSRPTRANEWKRADRPKTEKRNVDRPKARRSKAERSSVRESRVERPRVERVKASRADRGRPAARGGSQRGSGQENGPGKGKGKGKG